MHRLVRLALALTLALPFAPSLHAQAPRPGLIVGRVLAPDGAAVAGAVLRATQGARTVLAEADDNGNFRLGGLTGGGPWTVAIRRLGFRPLAVDLELPAEGLRRNFTLERTAFTLDPQLVAAKWTGIRGVVGDARRVLPLAGAQVRLLGSDATTGSDSLGNFSLALPGGRDILLRIERAGFAPVLLSVAVPKDSYVELDVPLDTVLKPLKDLWIWRDLDQRLKFATPRSVQVSRAELVAGDAVSLGTALALAPSVTQRGVVINRRACVFVNGVPRPGYPVDAILANDVEFVEAYPPGSDLTRTLQQRWPPGATCGVPDGTIGASRAGARQVVQFVSVWLRTP